MRLCACITEKTAEDCIKVAKAIDTELIEHRIDFMDEIKNLDRIYNATKTPVIATNRSVKCGGHSRSSEEKRIAHLLSAIDAGCAMVDIELETEEGLKQRVMEKARERNCKIIISMHDFKKTPDTEELLGIMRREKEQGADIGKIVTIANSVEDCHSVLGLLLEARKEDFPLVAFAMGELGRFTRIVALLYGAPFTYVSVNESVAPGQLSVNVTRKILKELVS